MDNHVTGLFLDWSEGNAPAREEIDAHLRACPACRAYFGKMSALLGPVSASAPRGGAGGEGAKELLPDPYLPARIRALAGGGQSPASAARPEPAPRRWMRWSLASAALMLAIALGIILGSGLQAAPAGASGTSTGRMSAAGQTDIYRSYYEAISQQNFSTAWESVSEQVGETHQ